MKLSAYRSFLLVLSLPVILRPYLSRETGAGYGIGLGGKVLLALKMIRNNIRIESGSNFVEHLAMATAILKVPPAVEGCIVECGSWKGASTANLSLVAAACGRRLEVFDSFEGLPEPAEDDRAHIVLSQGELHTYEKGGWSGSLREVSDAVGRYGSIASANFNPGYFDDSLPGFDEPCVFVFADVDLRESLKPCLRFLWPRLADGCHFFTHESTHLEIASLFFDRKWWDQNVGGEPPGLIGAGSGLGLIPRSGAFGSPLGYAVKSRETVPVRHAPQ